MDFDLKNSVLKTGTSIVGIVCKEGVVLAADRRVTAGNMIMDKDYQKIDQINDYLLMANTGSVSDAQFSAKVIAAELRLKELRSKRRPTVKESANFIALSAFQGIRQPSMIPRIVGNLVAGVNEDGTAELYTVEPAGGIMKVKTFDANFSSGMPFILGLLERQYHDSITLDEAVKLAVEAIKSSTQRDSASGGGIEVYTLSKEGIKKVIDQKIEVTYNKRE